MTALASEIARFNRLSATWWNAAARARLALTVVRGMRYLPVVHRASWVRDTSVNYIAEFARDDGPPSLAAVRVADARTGAKAGREASCASC